MALQLELFRTIIAAADGSLGAAPVSSPVHAVGAQAGRVRGREGHDYFHGGREFPLGVALGRVVLGLGSGSAESLSESLGVVLGVRETDPRKISWRPLGEAALEAIAASTVMVDADELWVDPQDGAGSAGSMVASRVLPISCSEPGLAMDAWDVASTSWAKSGILTFRPTLDVDAERPVMDYGDLRSLAVVGGPNFAPTLGELPLQLGMNEFFLQVQIIAARSTHPLRGELERAGLARNGQTILLLVVLPSLAGMTELLAGPVANNVLGSKLDAVFSGCQSPYSAWSSMAARQVVDEFVMGGGEVASLERLDGTTEVVLSALGGIMEGGLVAASRMERAYGNSVAEWIGSVFCQDPAVGAGLVREIVSRRAEGERLTLETREVAGRTGMVLVHLDEQGNPVRDERLF